MTAGRDLRLVPTAGAAWVGAWLGTLAAPPGWLAAGLGGLVLTGLAAWRRSAWVGATAVALLLSTLIGGVRAVPIGQGPLADLAAEESYASVVLELRTDPQFRPAQGIRPAYLVARARVVTVSGRGHDWRVRAPILVVASGPDAPDWTQITVGSTLEASGRLAAPDPGADVAAVLRVRSPVRVVSGPSPGLRGVERVRAGLRDAVEHRRPEPRALVPALVLGDTSRLQADLVADFQTTGLTHLTAVSGANLTLLLAFLLLVARWVGLRGWWLRLVGLAGLVVFVALCRTEPSVLRAAAMGLVALAALGSGGRTSAVRNLAVAMSVLLCLDPFLSRSAGFALSVLASAGIIWWARPWALVLGRWTPLPVAEAVTVPLAAHLTTLPLVAALSGQVSAAGLLANALAGPFVGPATILGFAAAGLSLLGQAPAAVAGFGAASSAQVIIWIAHLGASLPGSAWRWPAGPVALAWLGAVALAVGLVLPYVLARRALSLVLALGMIAALGVVPAQPGWPPRGWLLVACDIGQGDGLVARVARGVAVVVDTGPEPAAHGSLSGSAGHRLGAAAGRHPLPRGPRGRAAPGSCRNRSVGQIWVEPAGRPRPARWCCSVPPAQAHGTPVVAPARRRRRPGRGCAHCGSSVRCRTRPTGTSPRSRTTPVW